MLFFIINPKAGNGKAMKTLALLEEKLTRLGIEAKILLTEAPGHATELAQMCCADARCSGIVAVGGDGTVNETVGGMDFSANIPFGILPGGTGNDFNRVLNGTEDAEAILDAILSAQTRRVDYLTVCGKPCLNVASMGFDVDVLCHYNRYSRRIHGSFVYDLAVLRAILGLRFMPAHVTVDDGKEELDSCFVLVAAGNGCYYGGGIPVTPEACIDDGLIDVCIIDKVKYLSIPKVLLHFMKGRHIGDKTTIYRKCKSIKITFEGEEKFNVDGQLFSTSHFDCRIVPGGMLTFARPCVK